MTEVLASRWAAPLPTAPPRLPASPWLAGDVIGCTVVNLVGLGMILGGLQGARHTVDAHSLLLLVNIAAAGLVVALAGNAVFLLSTLRHVGQLRNDLLVRREAPVPAQRAAEAGAGELVFAKGMTRFHRADCPAVQGKQVSAATPAAHTRAGRRPCGLCRADADPSL